MPAKPGRIARSGQAGKRPRALLAQMRLQIADDNLTVVAAGVAFYAVLSIFPALTALVTVFGLVLDPEQLTHQISRFTDVLPDQAAELLRGQLQQLAASGSRALGLGFIGSLAVALWSSSAGIRALMRALNIAYDVEESRSLPARIGLSLLLAVAAVVGVVFAIALLVVLPVASAFFGLGDTLQTALAVLKWPLAALAFWLGLTLMYRFAPNRDASQASWLNRGAVFAIVLWLIGSAIFSWYVGHFGSFGKTYGSLGAFVILMLWFLLSAWAVLIGAEINAVLDHEGEADRKAGRAQQAA